MKKSLLPLIAAITLFVTGTQAQRKCGMEYTTAAMIAADPSWEQKFEAQRASLQGIADAYKNARKGEARTTATSAVPVIFHILVTPGEYDTLGGEAGIIQRINSQMDVLNQDFNAQNADSSLIPYGWKPLYASSGIHFALAHTNPAGFGTPGYEINIIPAAPGGFNGSGNTYQEAKHAATGGLDSWDATKYLNIWCINPLDVPGLLGATVAPSFTPARYPVNEMGICMYFAALGKRASATDYYVPTGYASDYYDQGRTLTHEMGHFFEIWHTWGDDGGTCPWSGLHKDDGLADTPPEGNSHFYNYPDTIPGGTYYDICRRDGTIDTQTILYGIATLDFMNYTDDVAMHLFTTDQAAVMAAQVSPGGESYPLTQNPDLLNWSVKTAVGQIAPANDLQLSPNPSNGRITITFTNASGALQYISVTNMLGMEVMKADAGSSVQDYYSIDLSAMSKGIYFVNCNFASGNIIRKISLQ